MVWKGGGEGGGTRKSFPFFLPTLFWLNNIINTHSRRCQITSGNMTVCCMIVITNWNVSSFIILCYHNIHFYIMKSLFWSLFLFHNKPQNIIRVGFNIFEAFPYPGIMGQNWPLSREIPGFNFFIFKGKLMTKKLLRIFILSKT